MRRPRARHERCRWRTGARVDGSRPAFGLALIVLAAALIISFGGRAGLAPQGASAKGALNASAGAIDLRGASLSLAHGGYFYSRTLTWFRYAWAGTRQFTVSGVSEEWVARNGSGRQRFGVLKVAGRPSDGLGAAGHPSDTSVRAHETPFPLSLAVASRGIGLSYSQLRAPPADPLGLTHRLDGLVARQLRGYPRGARDLASSTGGRVELRRAARHRPIAVTAAGPRRRVSSAGPDSGDPAARAPVRFRWSGRDGCGGQGGRCRARADHRSHHRSAPAEQPDAVAPQRARWRAGRRVSSTAPPTWRAESSARRTPGSDRGQDGSHRSPRAAQAGRVAMSWKSQLVPTASALIVNATSSGSVSAGSSPLPTAVLASRSSRASQRRMTLFTAVLTGPGRASNSTIAVVRKHPPGNGGSPR